MSERMPPTPTPPPELEEEKYHPLRNAAEIQRILLEGSEEEQEALRQFHGLTSEQFENERTRVVERHQKKREAREKIKRAELFGPIEPGEEETHAVVESQQVIDESLDAADKEARTIAEQLTDQQKETIATVSQLPFSSSDRRAIVLIIGGLKPATTVTLREQMVEEGPEFIAQLSACGLNAGVRSSEGPDDHAELLIAQDVATLERLRGAYGYEHHREYGELMGYPETAIDAFIQKQMLDTRAQEISPKIMNPTMRLSRGHWPEELHQLARWSAFVSIVSPELMLEVAK